MLTVSLSALDIELHAKGYLSGLKRQRFSSQVIVCVIPTFLIEHAHSRHSQSIGISIVPQYERSDNLGLWIWCCGDDRREKTLNRAVCEFGERQRASQRLSCSLSIRVITGSLCESRGLHSAPLVQAQAQHRRPYVAAEQSLLFH